MNIHSDPSQAIDFSKPNPNGVFAMLGYVGPFPSCPCRECGSDNFTAGDWGMGYRCENGHVFGTAEEWAYERGQL